MLYLHIIHLLAIIIFLHQMVAENSNTVLSINIIKYLKTII